MPRSTKESSDDENDAKTGRRTKTIGSVLNAVTDSPLRRSTRNKPTISPTETAGDTRDGSSTISAVSSVQSGRNTRRRTITTIPESTTISELLPTRSLRSRKTSTTSTTSLDSLSVDPIVVIADCESQKDNAKSRITRKSTSATVSTVDTPPVNRFRRQIRAGSESKTMSPSNTVRTTRRTRASSVDLDEQRDEVQYNQNKGQCGLCGDDYRLKRPRPNENGGIYGTKTMVKTYREGQEITVNVTLTSNHQGYFEFSLCPLLYQTNSNNNSLSIIEIEETEECFKKNPILTVDGKNKYILSSYENGNYQVKLVLPKGIICNQCSLRWQWKVANNWGICHDGTGAIGCGPQETFRTCSDIRII